MVRRSADDGMARRAFIVSLAGIFSAPLAAEPQRAGKVWRIGIVTPGTAVTTQHLFDAFREGMRAHGYREGQDAVFERRFGGFTPGRLPDAAADLVRSKVDVIVTSTDQAIAAVKQQTRTIPVVMANSSDPVATGFVASLARPGGNPPVTAGCPRSSAGSD
jgi:putative tryptophan/tyrosine transport system substrate-binding protein